jgi:hypothetical protein
MKAFESYGELVEMCEERESEGEEKKRKLYQSNALIAQGISAHELGDHEMSKTLLFKG